MFIDVDPFFEDCLLKRELSLRLSERFFSFFSAPRSNFSSNTCFVFELRKPFNSQINFTWVSSQRRFLLEKFQINPL